MTLLAPGTQYVVSEEDTAINENNRFTERFNFELAFNLPLSKSIVKGAVSRLLRMLAFDRCK